MVRATVTGSLRERLSSCPSRIACSNGTIFTMKQGVEMLCIKLGLAIAAGACMIYVTSASAHKFVVEKHEVKATDI
jgi:hypothetical protein